MKPRDRENEWRPDKVTLRSLRHPEAVAAALFPGEQNAVMIPAMFDRCAAWLFCPRRHRLAGTGYHYCAADERTCEYKDVNFMPAPPLRISSKWSKVRPEVNAWLTQALSTIAAYDDSIIGTTAVAWILDDWSAVDAQKPKRRERIAWRMACQQRLYETIAAKASDERPWRRERGSRR